MAFPAVCDLSAAADQNCSFNSPDDQNCSFLPAGGDILNMLHALCLDPEVFSQAGK
jgi:hypothetical protein